MAIPTSFKANGNIAPMRFVKQDTTAQGAVLQGTAGSGSEGSATIGISQQGQRNAAWSPLQDGYAAIAGEGIGVYTENEVCYLSIADTVTNGMKLKSDANGKGIPAATDKDRYGAIALQDGVSGNDIKVAVQSGYLSI